MHEGAQFTNGSNRSISRIYSHNRDRDAIMHVLGRPCISGWETASSLLHFVALNLQNSRTVLFLWIFCLDVSVAVTVHLAKIAQELVPLMRPAGIRRAGQRGVCCLVLA